MEEYARHWPQYGFDKNYGHVDSEVHRAGLQVCAKPCVCAACTLLCSCIRKGLRVTQRRCFRPKTAAASQGLRQHPRLHTSSARQQCFFTVCLFFHYLSVLSLCHRPLTIARCLVTRRRTGPARCTALALASGLRAKCAPSWTPGARTCPVAAAGAAVTGRSAESPAMRSRVSARNGWF